MARYYIDFPLTLYVTETIEAGSADEALEIAKKLVDSEFVNDLEEKFDLAEHCMDNLGEPEVTLSGDKNVTLTQELIDEYLGE